MRGLGNKWGYSRMSKAFLAKECRFWSVGGIELLRWNKLFIFYNSNFLAGRKAIFSAIVNVLSGFFV